MLLQMISTTEGGQSSSESSSSDEAGGESAFARATRGAIGDNGGNSSPTRDTLVGDVIGDVAGDVVGDVSAGSVIVVLVAIVLGFLFSGPQIS
jgi:hypothetical protein